MKETESLTPTKETDPTFLHPPPTLKKERYPFISASQHKTITVTNSKETLMKKAEMYASFTTVLYVSTPKRRRDQNLWSQSQSRETSLQRSPVYDAERPLFGRIR